MSIDVQAPALARPEWAPWEVAVLFAVPALILGMIGVGVPAELSVILTGGAMLISAVVWLAFTAPVAADD